MPRKLVMRVSAAAIVIGLGAGLGALGLAPDGAPPASGSAPAGHAAIAEAAPLANSSPTRTVATAIENLLVPGAAAATLENNAARTITVAAAEPAANAPESAAQATDPLVDPPGRVGRLGFTDGTVSFHGEGQEEWAPATLNFPVTSGDSFWTETDARAEIQVGPLTLRMAGATEITVGRLDDEATQFEVFQGTVNLRMDAPPEGGVLIRLPLGEVTLIQAGRYRLDAGAPYFDAPPEHMQVTVFEGEARFDGKDGTQVIESGQSFTASGDPLAFTEADVTVTEFDAWAKSRDPRPAVAPAQTATGPVSDSPEIVWNEARVTPTAPQSSGTLSYVSPETTGYQDLDVYGNWATTADYGAVWYPSAVPIGWAPYRYGHWAYVAPWGWTWIDDAPWGFAPFHYGRWVSVGGRWGWWPGAYVPRPVYAPALVAFIGGGGWSIGIAFGSGPAIGWVPLSPHDHYRPCYKASPKYVKKVNITNVTVNKTVINNNVTVVNNNGAAEALANSNGATVVSTRAFTGGARADRARLNLREGDLARARVRDSLAELAPSEPARRGIAAEGPARRAPVTARGGRNDRDQAAEITVPAAPGPEIRRTRANRVAPASLRNGDATAGAETSAQRSERRQDNAAAPQRAERAERRNVPAATPQGVAETQPQAGTLENTEPAAKAGRSVIQSGAQSRRAGRTASNDTGARRAERRAAPTAIDNAKSGKPDAPAAKPVTAARPAPAAAPATKADVAAKPVPMAKPVTAAKPAATLESQSKANLREMPARELRPAASDRVSNGGTGRQTPVSREAKAEAAPRPAPPARVSNPAMTRVQPAARNAKPAVRAVQPIMPDAPAGQRLRESPASKPAASVQRPARAAPATTAAPKQVRAQAPKQAPQRVQAAPARQAAATPREAPRQAASKRKAQQQTGRAAQSQDGRNARESRSER